jgi:hypothetical protein
VGRNRSWAARKQLIHTIERLFRLGNEMAAHFPKLLPFRGVLSSRGFVEAFVRETKVQAGKLQLVAFGHPMPF